jgi:outer membrane protein assembly factor BamB
VNGADWLHWRGPEQNGLSRETGLPDSFDLTTEGKNGLIWKKEFGGRSAPLVMGGKLYIINGYDTAKVTEGERVMCLDEATGQVEWEYKFNVFHTDIVSSRLGWTSLTADPKAGTIFAHTTGGHLLCLNAKDGKVVWQRQLTEEYGRVTGYGGRIASPIFDSGLVIVGLVNGSWGDMARGSNRFVAFDSATGNVVWWSSPSDELKLQLRGTYYSNPVVTVIGGQRLLISGGADGAVHALKVRTGERVWSHVCAANVVNPSPVVDGDWVYVCHGEENPEGSPIGRVVCLDAGKVVNKKPKVVWDSFRRKYKENNGAMLAKRFGLASPALADGILYVPDDGGELHAFDAKDGELLWKEKYGTVSRGAPLVADGRLYVFDVNAKLAVIKNIGRNAPKPGDVEEHRFRAKSGTGFVETNATPIAVNGRLYFQTREFIYCVGNPAAKPAEAKYQGLAPETAMNPNAEPVAIMVYPADVVAKPGETLKFTARFVDANGRELPAGSRTVAWSLPLPPPTPTGAQPPALAGEVKDGEVKLGPLPSQQGVVEAKAGKLTARARVRVAPQLPYKQDFEKTPVGATPGGWVNTQGKYIVAEVEVGGKKEKVLSKVNNDARPPIARANAYVTLPNVTNVTIQCDMVGGEVGGKFPDMGVIANRYLLILDGKTDPDKGKRQLRIVTWEARNRVNSSVNFEWKSGTWYTVKFVVNVADGKATLQGKVWERGQTEPDQWSIVFTDPNPNTEGAAGLYGYISNATEEAPGSTIYYKNLSMTANEKK